MAKKVRAEKANGGRKHEGGKRKVSKKKKAIQRWKYLKDIYAELDQIKERLARLEARVSEMSVIVAYNHAILNERLKLIEWFLGGYESMVKVKKDNG